MSYFFTLILSLSSYDCLGLDLFPSVVIDEKDLSLALLLSSALSVLPSLEMPNTLPDFPAFIIRTELLVGRMMASGESRSVLSSGSSTVSVPF